MTGVTRQAILRLLPALLLVGGSASALAAGGGSVLSDGTVRFEVGSATLTEESERVLDRLSALLKRRPDLDPIELVGHADARGAEGTNRSLSLRRANTVRAALVTRGIRKSRIDTRGAGSAEPLSKEDSDAARELNRRVEVWITPQRPVAEVTEIEREVRSREAAAPAWRDARVGQPLRRLARVRTGRESASEVSFKSKDQVQLGPEALVVIYDAPRPNRTSKADVDDIEVEQGTIFASMASKDRAMRVKTKPSRVKVRSKRTRVDVRRRARRAKGSGKAAGKTAATKKGATKTGAAEKGDAPAKKVSTVSVFEGRSEVSAKGKSVLVKEGFGTRVKEGEAPEPPRPLPVAPAWTTADPYVTFEGRALDLAWRRAPNVPAVEVQLGAADDPEVKRPSRLWRVDGDRTRGGYAPAGLHYLRLVGVDDRGISGAPGKALRVVSLPAPQAPGGARWPVVGGRVRMTKPGALTFGSLPQGTLSSTTSTTTAINVTLVRPGAHRVPYQMQVGGQELQGELQVWVDTATLTAAIAAPVVEDSTSSTELTFSVQTGAGPVDGLTFVAGVVPRMHPRLKAEPGVPTPLADCGCGPPPQASEVEALGDGRYRWVLERPLPSPTSSVTVRLFEVRGRLAVELTTPIGAREIAAAARADKSGFFGGLRVGALLSHDDAPTAELSAEGGYRLEISRGLELDLSLEAGWLKRTIAGQSIHAIPILARAAVALDLGAPRVYAGGGGGVRLLSPGPEPGAAATGFLGVGYRFGHSEIIAEGSYRLVGRAPDSDQELAGWAVTLGYRLGTFYVP